MITIRTWVKELKRRMMTFGYQILLKETGEPVAEGETRHICLDTSGRPRAIPEPIRSSLGETESGFHPLSSERDE